jgi:hypothetical protein
MRDVAGRLIAHEGKESKASGGHVDVVQVCEKLRPHLATLMGKAGFRAILARALAVSTGEMRWLAVVEVNAEGVLEGWDKACEQVEPKVRTEGGMVLVAQLLGLLVAFIGDNLTLRLVRDVWPRVSLEDLNFTEGDSP